MTQKMKLKYAHDILDGSYVFGNRLLSQTDEMLIVQYDEDEFPYRVRYYGTKLVDGVLQTDDEGYVIFEQVEPIIDNNTKFRFIKND